MQSRSQQSPSVDYVLLCISKTASAALSEPCNSLGLMARRPECCCVGFGVMGQNGPFLQHSKNQYAALISIPHQQPTFSSPKLHDTKDTHMHTCVRITAPLVMRLSARTRTHPLVNHREETHVEVECSAWSSATGWNQTLQMRAELGVSECLHTLAYRDAGKQRRKKGCRKMKQNLKNRFYRTQVKKKERS